MTRKGIYFVSLQALIFLLFALIGGKQDVGAGLKIFGLITSIVGLTIIAIAVLQLNRNLSPFPSPKAGSQLITSGLYSIVRHPIYLGIIVLFLGYTLYTASWFRLALTILISALFYYKSTYEESLLMQKFETYRVYRKSTSKIFPFT